MKRRLSALALALAVPLCAHRLDEYLQATIFSVEKDRVHASLRLIPGVAVAPAIGALIDSNGDGVISATEQRAYAERVLHDVSLSVDGQRLTPQLVSMDFPGISDMKEGIGEIHIELTAALPANGSSRKLVFENHHLPKISAYLVNCLLPRDRDIRIESQRRNELQSFYQLDYSLQLQGFASMFRLGMRHIAEGTDHLLFLLTLLLPAPLIAVRSHWAGFAGIRPCLLKILKVVTAFTVGHSITLALAALSVIHLPSRPIEVLIALSILVSAVHAFRPLFPGREAAIAAFFGLIHGLAFASTLGGLGLGRWERLTGILGFNLGIEALQLIVVAGAAPTLVLLARNGAYPIFRIGGAFVAGAAALRWLAERLLLAHVKA